MFYAFLALFSYTLATLVSSVAGVTLFLVTGGIAEIAFWLGLLKRRDKVSQDSIRD